MGDQIADSVRMTLDVLIRRFKHRRWHMMNFRQVIFDAAAVIVALEWEKAGISLGECLGKIETFLKENAKRWICRHGTTEDAFQFLNAAILGEKPMISH
jgi:hypothetical protein